MNFKALSTKFWPALAAALSLLLAATGCSSAGSSHLVYVATGDGIFAYRIDNNSGVPTAVFTAPFVVGTSPSAIVITPSNQFAYVTNQQDNTISLLKVDASSGTLTEVTPRTNTGVSPATMVMDTSGSFLFVADQGSNDVEAFSIGSNGSLALKSTVPLGSSPSALALSGNLLFVAVPNLNAIYVFSVSGGTMTPVANSPFLVPKGVDSLTVDPSASFLYVPNPATDTISGFSINSGALAPLPGSPYGTTVTGNLLNVPVALAINPTGTYLYAANFAVSGVSGFSIASNGDLTSLITAAGSGATNPNLITFDANGKYLYVGNSGSKSITELTIDSSGILSSSNTIQVGTVARSLAFTK